MKKGEKLNFENLAKGELAHQLDEALLKMSQNMTAYGDEAEHGITITIKAGKDVKEDYWKLHPVTATVCRLKETQIGSSVAITFDKNGIYDGESQQDLPLAK